MLIINGTEICYMVGAASTWLTVWHLSEVLIGVIDLNVNCEL